MAEQRAKQGSVQDWLMLEQARRRALQLEAVAEISGAASSILDLEQLLPMAAELIRDRFDLYYAGIFLVDDSGQRAVLRAGTGDAGRRMVRDGHALQVGGQSMIGWSVANAQPRIALDVETDKTRYENPLLPETRSEMALPLINRGQALGAMTIQSTRPGAFAREDVTVLQVMADQLANAIENARLFQERERRITELGIVNEIGEALASALGVEELLQIVHQQVCRLFDAENFYIAIYDEDSDSWISAFHLEQGRRQAPARYPVGTGLTGHIIRSRKPVLLRSAKESIAFGREHRIEIVGEIARSWLGVPLLAADKLVGVMAIQDYERGNLYTRPDLVLFSTIAGQVAGALNNLRLLEEARQRAQEMEIINRFGTALSACQDLPGVLQVVRAGVHDLLDIDDLYLTLYDSETRKVTTTLRIVDGEAKRTGTSWTLGRGGLIDHLIHSCQPLLLPDRVIERVEEMGIATVPVRAERAPASWLGVPMTLGERVLGTLVVLHRSRPRAYSEHSQELLTAVANRAALALQSVRLLAETRAALVEVQSAHRSYLRRGWQEHLHQRSLLQEGAFIHAQDGGQDPPQAKVVRGFWRPEIDKAVEGGSSERPGSEEKSVEVGGLAVPISLRGQTIGVLGVESPMGDGRWTDEDLALLQAVGEQLAQTLEAARLFADTERRAEQLATLHQVGLDITTALDLDGVLQALYEQIQHILDVDLFHVALYDDVTASVELPLVRDREGPFEFEPAELREARRIVAHVIGTGRPLHLPDLAGTSEALPVRTLPASARTGRAYMGVPLVFREKVFGVLSVQSDEPGAYSREDVELLSTIATQASIAIQNARAYERLVGTAEQLREVDRLKTQFLANMSHELRTPLNSIIGFSKVMLKGIDGPLTELQQADLTSIHSSGQHLLELINSILDMSKIEAGKMDLAFDQVRLPEIFDTVLSTTRALIKDRPIQLRTEVPEPLPMVWADTQRVRQVLINLLSNAAKFTEEGSITLKAETGPEYVTVSVVDTGVGIDSEAQKRLFVPFQQVDASTSRRAGGTGLGLAISRRFVEMMSGDIWVESTPGQGATFSFTLPTYSTVQDAEEAWSAAEPQSEDRLVLVVDDDQGVITLLSRYLRTEGYQVAGVTDPRDALSRARQLAPRLAAIVLDLVMPHMDGWAVLEALKADPATREIPVIQCSIEGDQEQGKERGVAMCLQKPVMRDELVAALREVCGQADSPVRA